MINSSNNQSFPSQKLMIYLKEQFSLNDQAISLAIKHSKLESAPFPIVLWNFGLITVDQYQVLLDWIIDNEYT